MAQLFAAPWRNVPDGAQIVRIGGDGRPLDVGPWIVVGDGVVYAFAHYRMIDGVYARVDPNDLVPVVVPEVPDTATAVLNLMKGGFTIEATWEE